MKNKDKSDIKNKTIAELEKLADDLKTQIGKAKIDMAMHKAKNTNLAKNLKGNLARVLNTKRGKEIYANA